MDLEKDEVLETYVRHNEGYEYKSGKSSVEFLVETMKRVEDNLTNGSTLR